MRARPENHGGPRRARPGVLPARPPRRAPRERPRPRAGAPAGTPAIADYAVIGDGRSAALVSRGGSIDWLCWPRFDSPALFAAMLDPVRGGCFRIAPAAPARIRRRYRDDTNVLVTEFDTEAGSVRLTDWMPVASEAEKRHEPWPEHHLLRRLEGLSGEVPVEVVFDPRPGTGCRTPRMTSPGALGWHCDAHPGRLALQSDVALAARAAEPGLGARFTLRGGERREFSLTLAMTEPGVVPPPGDMVERRLAQSLAWWRAWAGCCRYDGPFRDAVVRGALTLKLLAHAPSGACIAAPTTSLPETVGGTRNWDYRFCWLRDASRTVRALFGLGYDTEALAFLDWLLNATRLTWPELRVLYDVYGRAPRPERRLDHLSGFRESRPVRAGNAAADQFQLDVYGEVIEASYQALLHGHTPDRATAGALVGFGRTVCRRWREPDHGIWEVRGERLHYTQSKVMTWVALERLIAMGERGLIRAPLDRFRAERNAIRSAVEARAWCSASRSYVRTFDGADPDASLLLLGVHGYADPASARMASTRAWLHERLGARGLLRRYPPGLDGMEGVEGAFAICSFWDVDCRALAGDLDGAHAQLEFLAGFANDVGLFAEEIDPASGALLGNFPQAYTHVGLIGAALTLERCAREPRPAHAFAHREIA